MNYFDTFWCTRYLGQYGYIMARKGGKRSSKETEHHVTAHYTSCIYRIGNNGGTELEDTCETTIFRNEDHNFVPRLFMNVRSRPNKLKFLLGISY